jgi:hypothetical protein
MKRKAPKERETDRDFLQAVQMIQNPRVKGGMAKTSIWLPSEMLNWLKEEAAKRDTGMADEIRRRLLISFSAEQEPRDPYTELLLKLIERAARILAADEPWHATRMARETLQAAINNLLWEISRFSGRDVNVSKLQDRYGADAKPETIGPIVAHAVFVDGAKEIFRELAENRKLAESQKQG